MMTKAKTLIESAIESRILVLDGAMGTMIQKYNLGENDYRGSRFKDYHISLKGNNDLLVITQPQIIREIHEIYLNAGADIIETNSFNAQAISLADYEMADLSYELNLEAAKIAKLACTKFSTPEKPRFVAGSIGPSNKSLSLPSDLNNPEKRSISFSEMAEAYAEQTRGLIDGGVDILLVETIFDTLNAKSCLFAISQVFEEKKVVLPVMISVTISDNTGRTLSGQTLEAFVNSISHFPYLSIGLNCALGAEKIKPYLRDISTLSKNFVSVYPNAGLPDQYGNYMETPAEMTKIVKSFIDEELVNIIGGCCGTGPEHIKLFSKIAKKGQARRIKVLPDETVLSGTDCLKINNFSNFVNVGERTNVAGSKKFARLIRENNYDEAIKIAAQQIENGANIIDISFDDGLLKAKDEMETFLRLIAAEPEITRVPIMIDSSDFDVIETALQNCQGKSIVNSISLKNGEEEFKRQALKIRQYGSAMVIMAFDENGQATDYKSKIEICSRAYNILTKELKIPATDIVFDCNILTIGTGMTEHSNYAVDFINSVRWIKQNLPGAKTSGGISNLSFAFRGNNFIREALHSVFLFHAIEAGLDMGIVNAGNLPVYDELDEDLVQLCNDLILNKDKDATDKLLRYAELNQFKENIDIIGQSRNIMPVDERLKTALIRGNSDFVDEDIADALKNHTNPVDIIEGPLMSAMNHVGELFGSGRMFLPQVMKSARVMKKMTELIQPAINEYNGKTADKAGKILIATVKGDVHDIGKNIAAVVLSCNSYDIIDLGIMVHKDIIVDEAINQDVQIIGLSGLISPSLYEMEQIAAELEQRGLNIPLLVSGATTSKTHTAVKIAPLYSGPVVHVKDASKAAYICNELLNPKTKAEFVSKLKLEQEKVRQEFYNKSFIHKNLSIEEARRNAFVWKKDQAKVVAPAILNKLTEIEVPVFTLIPFINWTSFFAQWKIAGKYPQILGHPEKGVEAKKLFDDAQFILNKITQENLLKAKAVIGIFKATSKDESIILQTDDKDFIFKFPRNLSHKSNSEKNQCLSDYIAPGHINITDYLGLFALTAGLGADKLAEEFVQKGDNYNSTMVNILADCLAEAYSEYLHFKVRTEIWCYSNEDTAIPEELFQGNFRGIRPAPGYAVCPDHAQKSIIFEILDVQNKASINLTENHAMLPAASVCGFYFAHPGLKYFKINE